MAWSILADLVMAAHFAFTAYVVFGGLVALWRPRLAALHIPCLAYGTAIEIFGWTCPLTPLEWDLRARAGEAGHADGFLETYLGPVLYPEAWGEIRWLLAGALVVFNLAVYAAVVVRVRRRREESRAGERT
ncbi:MAG: DUF2784 domain-containing protein [Gemmatimonadota bacterium]|nr:DUF2784 domain-containing protein [Gemmatimonadota bacterium]